MREYESVQYQRALQFGPRLASSGEFGFLLRAGRGCDSLPSTSHHLVTYPPKRVAKESALVTVVNVGERENLLIKMVFRYDYCLHWVVLHSDEWLFA